MLLFARKMGLLVVRQTAPRAASLPDGTVEDLELTRLFPPLCWSYLVRNRALRIWMVLNDSSHLVKNRASRVYDSE